MGKENIVTVERKTTTGAVDQRHHYLLPEGLVYQDQPNMLFSIRTKLVEAAGAVLHDPDDNTPAVFKPYSGGHWYQHEYYSKGSRREGPNGFAVEVSDGYGVIKVGYKLTPEGIPDTENQANTPEKVMEVVVFHAKDGNQLGKNTLSAAGLHFDM